MTPSMVNILRRDYPSHLHAPSKLFTITLGLLGSQGFT
jgi:hypothetical protein